MNNNSTEHIKVIYLPEKRNSDWKKVLPITIKQMRQETIEIDCQDWLLNYKEIKYLINILSKNELKIHKIRSFVPETIVSAAAHGIETFLIIKNNKEKVQSTENLSLKNTNSSGILFHQGTLRSGETLSGEGDILLLGDVNPGARVSAGGDVLIWGRLRGIAHAGKNGNKESIIIALELRPVQLRIANAIARGPEEKPEQGLAEEARLIQENIIIQPAKPTFTNKQS
tara:strand:+ start:297 stop:977 length:681 start_codon:yes stop_codon:yes gene_type:complete